MRPDRDPITVRFCYTQTMEEHLTLRQLLERAVLHSISEALGTGDFPMIIHPYELNKIIAYASDKSMRYIITVTAEANNDETGEPTEQTPLLEEIASHYLENPDDSRHITHPDTTQNVTSQTQLPRMRERLPRPNLPMPNPMDRPPSTGRISGTIDEPYSHEKIPLNHTQKLHCERCRENAATIMRRRGRVKGQYPPVYLCDDCAKLPTPFRY